LGHKVNLLSFILSLISLLLFYLLSTISGLKEILLNTTGIHPLNLLLYFTLVVLIIGVVGFKQISSWKTALRSIFTVLSCVILSGILTFVLFIGNLG